MKKLEVDTMLIEINEDKNDGNTPLHKSIDDAECEALD